MEDLAVPLVVGIVLAFVGFRQWLRHQQRLLVQKERLLAIEKGLEPPPWPQEPTRSSLGIDGVLLLSGLVWVALGLGGMAAAFVIVPQIQGPDVPPPAIALIGLPVALVGLAHLTVYAVRRRAGADGPPR